MLHTHSTEKVGDILRHWRKVRSFSQMKLAFAANVSTRHLSFVENGRAQPGYDLILRLSEALQLTPGHTNALLTAAGYAPCYTNWTLDNESTELVRTALTHILRQHEPYPAVVINRHYDIVMVNQAFRKTIQWLTGKNDLLLKYTNMYRLMFDEDGLQSYFADWPFVSMFLLKRLYEESILYQSQQMMKLYETCRKSNQPADIDGEHTAFEQDVPVLTFSLCKDEYELSFFSTITTFGSAIDVTIEELKIESMFPATLETRLFYQKHFNQD